MYWWRGSFALVDPEVGEEVLFEAGCQLAGLKDRGRLNLNCVSYVFQCDLLVCLEGARGLQDHVDGCTCECLRFFPLCDLQTRQVVRGDLACIDDVGRESKRVAGVLGYFRGVEPGLVLGEQELDLVVTLANVTL